MNGLNGKFSTLVVQSIIIVSSIIGATLWITGTIREVDEKIEVVRDSVVELKRSVDVRISAIETKVGDRWTSTHQRMWARRLKEHNSDLVVPYADDVIRDCARNSRK